MSDQVYELGGTQENISLDVGGRLGSLPARPLSVGWPLLAVSAGAGLLTIVLYFWLLGRMLGGSSALANSDYDMALHRTSARLAAVLQLVGGTALFLVIYYGLRRWRLDQLRGWCWQHRRIGLAAAILAGAANALWFSGALGGAFSSEDDMGYLFQARLFAHGQAMLPLASLGPLAQAFKWWWTVPGSHGLCSYQVPGHSLMLVLGVWLGHLSLTPVLEAAITCYATYRGALLLFGRRTSVLAVVLFLTSPYMVTVFASYSASTSAACMASLAVWAWAALLRKETAWRAFALGACIGLICWMRPPAAAFVALPMAAWLLVRVARGVNSWRIVPAGLLGVLPLVALYIGYCSYVSGHFSTTPGDVYWHRITSGELSTSHLVDAAKRESADLPATVIGLARLNLYLHGWPFSLLPLIVLPFLPGKGPKTWLLMVSVLFLLVFYAFYRSITGWYYFELAPLMYILSARSIVLTVVVLRRSWAGLSRAVPRVVCAGVILACFQSMPLAMAREYGYIRAFNVVADQVAGRLAGHRAAVLMQADMWRRWGPYLTGRNNPFVNDPIVYVNASTATWSRADLESVLGPREIYDLRIMDGQTYPLKLDRVSGELPAVIASPRRYSGG